MGATARAVVPGPTGTPHPGQNADPSAQGLPQFTQYAIPGSSRYD
jgi:hypothetical protein